MNLCNLGPGLIQINNRLIGINPSPNLHGFINLLLILLMLLILLILLIRQALYKSCLWVHSSMKSEPPGKELMRDNAGLKVRFLEINLIL